MISSQEDILRKERSKFWLEEEEDELNYDSLKKKDINQVRFTHLQKTRMKVNERS
jgi:hypothetical protein